MALGKKGGEGAPEACDGEVFFLAILSPFIVEGMICFLREGLEKSPVEDRQRLVEPDKTAQTA
ncbi:hypothetical protein HK16_11540 [Acetobacter senegalensis]|uniref:Uncharacterized protein n=1 Tax=Acetobacter senegalensis TaxID=446692 RepID=A0A252EJ03_9PROT|nr:hypothetical protein HK16_11540 [Acetobacter senegalensis]